MKNQIGARTVFMNAQEALRAALSAEMVGNQPKFSAIDIENMIANAIMTQSYLLLENVLDTKTTAYNFEPIVGNGVQLVSENRLRLQDTFYISEVGMYVYKNASATDNAGVPYTYPNPIAFPTTGAAAAMYALYKSGALNLTVNGTTIMENFDAQKFLMIPQTQQTAAFGAASPQTEFYGAGDLSAQCVVEPNILLIGSKNNKLQLTLKGPALTAVEPNSTVGLFFRGILMQNVTVVS